MSDETLEGITEDLERAELFEELTREELSEFASGAKRTSFEHGRTVIRERRTPECIFVVTSGSLEVVKKVPGGERLLAKLSATPENPTVVGERGLLDGSAASATVRSVGSVEAVRIPRQTFREMISNSRPAAFKVSYRLARTLAERLTRLDEEVVETAREIERSGEVDVEAFRDRLLTDWAT